MPKVLTLGEALIDFIPLQAGTALKDVLQFEKAPGGAPANVAAAVARLGGAAWFIGKVGSDAFGDFLVETLRRVGVGVTGFIRTSEAKTALAFVSLRADGERDFSFYRDPSADMLLRAEELQAEWFEPGDILHYGSISLIQEPARSATLRAIEIARGRGALISYDPNVRLPLWPSAEEARMRILETLPLADLVKLSDEELVFLTGEDSPAAVASLFTGTVKAVFVTRGAAGSEVHTRHGRLAVAPGHAVAAVDTTGAGDAFVGGVLAQLLERGARVLTEAATAAETLSFANACGALTTTRKGAISALPDRQEVLAVLQGQG